ncbi:hypothetical protein CRV24_000102 [Beauveria bassiana]|nr:hypothetical protein CRV24_000102 [Beauveria bassiana]
MPVFPSSTPADHSRYGIDWPWCIWARESLPDEIFSPDACKEKTPLVTKIAGIYEAPLNDDDHVKLRFTGCHNAAFYSLSPASLRAVAPFPKLIKEIGDAAYFLGTSFFERDLSTCLVNGTRTPQPARIVPLLVSSLSTKRFKFLFKFGKLFFAKNFQSLLQRRIETLRDSGEQTYNILSLSPDMLQLFDKALVGFKPLYVGATRSGHSVTYYATFSFHILGRNHVNSHQRAMPSDATLYRMQLPCEEWKLTEGEINALDACILDDGKVIRVPCEGRSEAESMLALLAFRWTISSYWFLAGSPGSQRNRKMGSHERCDQYEDWSQYDNQNQDDDPEQNDALVQENGTLAMTSVTNAIEELAGEFEQAGTESGS